LGITCEPFGKEHAASGGSYDTSKRISEEIYEYKAPYPVVYEHILVAGKKMSKSLGNIVTLRELLKILKPEVVRFFFFRVKITTHKDFEIEKEIIPLIKEYERVERLYYGMEHPSKGEDLDELKRIYELSQVEKPRKTLVQIPYAHLTTLFQISDDEDTITKNLEKSGHMRGTEEEIEEIREMIPLVRNFLNMPAAENLKFTIRRKLGKNEVRIGENEKECLEKIADMVDQVKDEDDLNSRIYFISKDLGLKPKDTFRMVYNLFLGKDHGPKAGTLLLSLDKDFVKKRLRLME
jgi:lysyl-tRNA synthetase class 1